MPWLVYYHGNALGEAFSKAAFSNAEIESRNGGRAKLKDQATPRVRRELGGGDRAEQAGRAESCTENGRGEERRVGEGRSEGAKKRENAERHLHPAVHGPELDRASGRRGRNPGEGIEEAGVDETNDAEGHRNESKEPQEYSRAHVDLLSTFLLLRNG
jgi:hypothetical protein